MLNRTMCEKLAFPALLFSDLFMRISTQQNRSTLSANQSMTSMIDMVFLLLIFFITLAANQVPEWELPSQLASGNDSTLEVLPTESEPDSEMIWIRAISKPAGSIQYQLNDNALPNLESLKVVLGQLYEIMPEGSIVMDIEDSIPLEETVLLHDAIRQVGFESLSLGLPAAK